MAGRKKIKKILFYIVEDDNNWNVFYKTILNENLLGKEIKIRVIEDRSKIGKILSEQTPDPGLVSLFILDVNLGGYRNNIGGLELIETIKNNLPGMPIIVISAYERDEIPIPSGVDFLSKRESVMDGIKEIVKKYVEDIKDADKRYVLLGKSEAIKEIKKKCEQIKRYYEETGDKRLSILLTGETGVGKEEVVNYLGLLLNKKVEAFNCTGVPDTLFESTLFGYMKGAFTGALKDTPGLMEKAEGGILFLDEIGDLPIHLQAKLLRVLQARKVRRLGSNEENDIDFILVTATNKDLMKEIREGRFRLDLYYRIAYVEIKIPPLRERKEDIEVLSKYFLEKYFIEDISEEDKEEIIKRLREYNLPGNVRELETIIKRGAIYGSTKDSVIAQIPVNNRSGGYPAVLNKNSIVVSDLEVTLPQDLEEVDLRKITANMELILMDTMFGKSDNPSDVAYKLGWGRNKAYIDSKIKTHIISGRISLDELRRLDNLWKYICTKISQNVINELDVKINSPKTDSNVKKILEEIKKGIEGGLDGNKHSSI